MPGQREHAMRHCGRWIVLTLALSAPAPVAAEDVFLTIGGGYNPAGNQVSLEKNALLFQRVLTESYPTEVRHDVFFADGDADGRDVQFVDPDFLIPRANGLLAEIFGEEDEIDYQYRNHAVPGVDGPTSRDSLERWFKETGATLGSGDRLFIYVAAHGGRSPDQEHPHNTVLLLWNRQPLRVHDLAAWLRHVPTEVPIAMVMVQCYSGGFAYSVFENGHADSGLADSSRCGFFATVHDRVAAGCTPDIDEANYHEYSTSFFEALRGKTRFDEPIARPDYDGDGRTSLAEAHAYVVLTSTTIDIPVCTSDEYLRAVSPPMNGESGAKTADAAAESEASDVAPADPEDTPLTQESPFDELLSHAMPAQRAVLKGLSEKLGIDDPRRAAAARAHADQYEKRRHAVEEERGTLQREYDQIREEIRQLVLARWPELNNRWHPVTNEILCGGHHDVIGLVESHPKFGRMEELGVKLDELADQKLDLERQWVQCRRLERTLETVVLAANLPLTASEEQVRAYQRLMMAENSFFGPQGDPVSETETAVP